MKKHIDEEKLEIIKKDLTEGLVLVEGKRDKKALKSLGLKDIIAISGKPLYKVVEAASNTKKEIIILTDFDKKGREIEKKLRNLFQKYGKQPNMKLRWKVMALGKNKIEDFGVLHTPDDISFEEDDFHVKTCTNFNKIRSKSRNRCARSYRKA